MVSSLSARLPAAVSNGTPGLARVALSMRGVDASMILARDLMQASHRPSGGVGLVENRFCIRRPIPASSGWPSQTSGFSVGFGPQTQNKRRRRPHGAVVTFPRGQGRQQPSDQVVALSECMPVDGLVLRNRVVSAKPETVCNPHCFNVILQGRLQLGFIDWAARCTLRWSTASHGGTVWAKDFGGGRCIMCCTDAVRALIQTNASGHRSPTYGPTNGRRSVLCSHAHERRYTTPPSDP